MLNNALNFVYTHPLFFEIRNKLIMSLVFVLIGVIGIKLINFILDKVFAKTKFDETLEQFIKSLFIWSLWIILILFLLQYWNVDISPLLASIGVVGLITGFALKDVLANLAAGLMILAVKPFRVGNFISSGTIQGTVVKIGTAATIIKTADNLKITVPNSSLWGDPIINYSFYDKRRIELIVGVDYAHDINSVIKILNQLIKKQKLILSDPNSQIFINKLGDYTIDIGLWVWVKRSDFLTVANALKQEIKESFEKHQIQMPNPTMDIYVRETNKK